MQRNDKTLIGNAAYGSLGGNANALNLAEGGFFGWSPDLANALSEQGYVRKPLEVVVIESPRFFNLMPNPTQWHASFRNLFERKATRVEGFNAGLTVETDDHAAGGAGELMQEPTNVVRARTEPSFSFVELYGRPIQRFHDLWIRYAIMDPDAKYALLTTLGSNTPTDLLADWYSATVLVYEPDPIHRGIEKAWLTTNFYPLNNGEVSGVRDLTTASELLRLTIPYAGLSAVGNGIDAFAKEIMDFTNLSNADPFNKASFIKEIAPDILAAADAGFKADAERTGAANVAPIGG